MNWYISILSGIIQGLTEFLPISSSGHLVILHNLFKIPESQLEFGIFLHCGTLCSIIFVFYKDIVKMLTGSIKTVGLLIIATIPAAVVAFFFEKKIESAFSQLRFVGLGLLVTAFFLMAGSISESVRKKKKEKITFLNAALIGVSQALAIFPGLSRSGLTISTALAMGISKKEAVRFSFLMAILAIAGAYLFEIKKLNFTSVEISVFNIIIGTVTAFFVGILAIKIVLKVLLAQKWHLFAVYCVFLGVLILIGF